MWVNIWQLAKLRLLYFTAYSDTISVVYTFVHVNNFTFFLGFGKVTTFRHVDLVSLASHLYSYR